MASASFVVYKASFSSAFWKSSGDVARARFSVQVLRLVFVLLTRFANGFARSFISFCLSHVLRRVFPISPFWACFRSDREKKARGWVRVCQWGKEQSLRVQVSVRQAKTQGLCK